MRRCLYLLHIVFVFNTSYAQQETLKFNHYSIDDGMLQSTVNATLKDSRGFVWFATQVGLNRFDGYTFKAYKNIPNDSTSLSGNWLWNLSEDSKGRLWIGTFSGGLNRYRYESDDFVRYSLSKDDSSTVGRVGTWAWLEREDGKFWVGFDIGMAILDPETGHFDMLNFPEYSTHAFAIQRDSKGYIWAASSTGLHKVHPETHKLERFPYFPDDTTRGTGNISRMIVDQNDLVWFGTSEGVFILNPNVSPPTYSKLDDYVDRNSNSTSTPQIVTYMYPGNNNRLWIGTRDGLYRIGLEPKTSGYPIKRFAHEENNSSSLNHNQILSVYESPSGDLWVGTRSGVNYNHKSMQKFDHVTANSSDPGSLIHPNVMKMLIDSDENLWVGSYGGLNLKTKDSQSFRHFTHDPAAKSTSLCYNYVMVINEDYKGNLWFGTNGGGVSRLSKAQRQRAAAGKKPIFQSYYADPGNLKSLASNVTYAIYEAPDSSLWFGHAGGISKYDHSTDTFEHFVSKELPRALSHRHVYNLFVDSNGRFWAATPGGLNLFIPETGNFKVFHNSPTDPQSLSSDFIVSFFESPQNGFWITTAAGINKMVSFDSMTITPRFQRIGIEDGLPDNFVYCMLEDNSHNLWVSANKGLTRISFTEEAQEIQSYFVEDGLQSNEFSQNSAFKAKDGHMFFGGINGFNVFHPDSIQSDKTPPKVAITDFKILNESVPISNNDETPLSRAINETKNIELSYRDDVISFEFSALSYASPHKNQYAYKMEGFDQDWIMSGSRRFATYTNLDPGEYTFRVKGSNSDNVWNEEGTSLAITITPPPWQTWWAYSLYALGCIGLIIGYVQFQLRKERRVREEKMRIQQAKEEERERVRKESSADFHDEAGNIITKIKLFTELAKREAEGKGELDLYLQRIDEHTKTLSSGMRDFIWVLDPEKDSLYETVLRLKDFGNSMYEHSDYRFSTIGPDEAMRNQQLSLLERRSIMLIFKEAMNNCLKYANGSEVQLLTELKGQWLTIELSDNGKGIDGSNEGYGLKNMQSRAKKISGQLDIESGIGEGTTIRLRFRLS